MPGSDNDHDVIEVSCALPSLLFLIGLILVLSLILAIVEKMT